MKKIYVILMFVCFSNYLWGGNNVIHGPSRVCPGDMVTYSWEVGFDINDCTHIEWRLKQNGQIIKAFSSQSSDPSDWFEWTFEWPLTAVGATTIEVAGPLCCYLCDNEDYKDVTVGLSAVQNITGPDNICPNSSASYSTSPVTSATSYTWDLPSSYWKVNGIAGPTVSGMGTSVQITSPPGGNGNYNIKVKAVSSTCGETSYYTRTIKLDYPVSIQAAGAQIVDFTGYPFGQTSYTWTVPTVWRKLEQDQNTITVDTRNNPGTIKLKVVTLCSSTLNTEYYYNPNSFTSMSKESNKVVSVFPNPLAKDVTIIFNEDQKNRNILILNESGTIIKDITISNLKETIDLSDLGEGTYYIKYWEGEKLKTEKIYKQ